MSAPASDDRPEKPEESDGLRPTVNFRAGSPAAKTGEATPADVAPPLPGRFGPYRIVEEIGRGGMGVVYKAYQESLKRYVALKVMAAGRFADRDAVRRFVREAESAARLKHPSIVPILDLGEHEGTLYFTMAHVEGDALDALLRRGALGLRERVKLLLEVADAVAYANEQGIIHRDLKPANILVAPDGTPMVTDFGLAGRTGTQSSISATGQILGTPNYMAPEQARGALSSIDGRTDVYGLGATLYEALTGRPPFSSATGAAVLLHVIARDPEPPRRLDPSLPKDIDVICQKAMHKEMHRRYPTVAAFRDDLRRYLDGEPISARPSSVTYRIAKRLRRNKTAALLATLLLVAIGIAVTIERRQASLVRGAWKLVLSDAFDGPELGRGYRVKSGRWEMKDRKLMGQGAGHAVIELPGSFQGNVELFALCRVLPGSAKNEIAVMLGRAGDEQTGYYLGFGGDYGMTAVDRLSEEVRLLRSPPVEAGKPYQIQVSRRESLLEMKVDGERVATFLDPMPLNAAEYDRLWLGTFDGALSVERLEVHQEMLPEMLPATSLGDRLFERGAVDAAEREYENVARDHPGKPIQGEALFKAGLCKLSLGRTDEALQTFESVGKAGASPFHAGLSRINAASALRLQGRLNEAFARLRTLERETVDAEMRYRVAAALDDLGTACWRASRQRENEVIRHLIIERFPELPLAEKSASIIATMADDLPTLCRKLEKFLEKHERIGKVRMGALSLLAAMSLADGDARGALDAAERTAREFQGKNGRFAMEGLRAKGLIEASLGRHDEALAAVAPMRDPPLADAFSRRMARHVEAFVARQRGDLARAIALTEAGVAHAESEREEARLDRLEVALCYRAAGKRGASDDALTSLQGGDADLASKVAALFLCQLPLADYLADQSLEDADRQLFAWEYLCSEGRYLEALELDVPTLDTKLDARYCRALLFLADAGKLRHAS